MLYSNLLLHLSSGFSGVPEQIYIYTLIRENCDSAVGITTAYGLTGGGVGIRVLVGARFFSSPCLPDGSWGPLSLLLKGYGELFLRG
jgi:hypothetical protein